MLPDLQPSSRLQGGGVEFQVVHLFVLVREFGEVWTSTETAERLEAGRKTPLFAQLKNEPESHREPNVHTCQPRALSRRCWSVIGNQKDCGRR